MYKIPSPKGEIRVYESYSEFKNRNMPKLQERIISGKVSKLKDELHLIKRSKNRELSEIELIHKALSKVNKVRSK